MSQEDIGGSEHVMWAFTHHREMYFKRKQEERKKAKEEKRQAYVVWLSLHM